MLERREQLFRCDFEAKSVHVYAHVLAWDGPEALSLFAAELRGDGVEVPGTIEVRPLGRGAPVTARFKPVHRVPGTALAEI